MKTYFNFFAIGLASGLGLGVFSARADLEVSVGVQISANADFYQPLAANGTWVEVGTYGRCWHPAGVAVEWRPYCDGHWEWTDCGWYWVSDEPWAWACYHYGSWAYDGRYGWVWAPGIEWAPAWVYWREGGGHIGWAPYGPRGMVVAPSQFVFVESGHFNEQVRPSTVIINNTTIINGTTQIAEGKRETRTIGGRQQQVVVNEGPGVAVVEKATGKKFTAVSVQEVDRQTQARVPAEIKRKVAEPGGKENAPVVQEQPKTASERKVTPVEIPDHLEKASPPGKTAPPDKAGPPEKTSPPDRAAQPDQGKAPSKDKVAPSPRPPTPESPVVRPPEQPGGADGGKSEGQGPEGEKEKGQDKDRP